MQLPQPMMMTNELQWNENLEPQST